MPLHKGKSEATFKQNVREMVNAGHPVKQAVAAAYRERGESGGKDELRKAVEDGRLGSEHQRQAERLLAGGHVSGRDRAKLRR